MIYREQRHNLINEAKKALEPKEQRASRLRKDLEQQGISKKGIHQQVHKTTACGNTKDWIAQNKALKLKFLAKEVKQKVAVLSECHMFGKKHIPQRGLETHIKAFHKIP